MPSTPVSAPPTQSAVNGRPGEPGVTALGNVHPTMMVIGNNEYPVDPERDPQVQPSPSLPAANGVSGVGDAADPLAQQMEQLRSAPTGGGSIGSTGRRNSAYGAPKAAPVRSPVSPGPGASPSGLAAPAPAPGPTPNRDYRNSAEFVVGSYPAQPATSRPTSPQPPVNVHMRPPQSSVGSAGGVSVW